MGLESELRHEIRMTKLRKAILSSVQLAGVLTIATLAPKVLSILPSSNRGSEKTISGITRLIEKGLLKRTPDGISLTALGQKYLDRSTLKIQRPKRWDKKWRIVIFDIAEHRKRLRNQLRDMLLKIGFVRLQDSVWVFPYDCEELIALLKTDYQIGKEVLYIIADKIEGDYRLKLTFGIT